MTTRKFPGRYESLAAIADFIRTEACSCGLGNKEVFELETAVDEAVSNIIEHSYGGEDIGDITCRSDCQPIGLEIILEDQGQPFDPTCVPIPDISAPLEDRKNNGLGIFMMCQLVDKVDFDFNKSRNQLTLFKKK
jgi:serine/threonine-protein kinase RsbW